MENFNWLRSPWESNVPKLKALQEKNFGSMKQLTSQFKGYFTEFVCAKYFTSKKQCLLHFYEFPNLEEKKLKFTERAYKGTWLNFNYIK